MSAVGVVGWDRLRHGGLLLDPPRLRRVAEHTPEPLAPFAERELRRLAAAVLEGSGNTSEFVSFVLERVCGFGPGTGSWLRGNQVAGSSSRRTVTGEVAKPRQLWQGSEGAVLPVFVDDEPRLGVGRGRRAVSHVVQWLRGGGERLALLTNGPQWRLVFAGLDFDAWCEWDVELWLEEGVLSPQVETLRTLVNPRMWTPTSRGAHPPLLQAILDSRKGQAELSAALGERVREAVELLVQAHGDVLRERCSEVAPAEIYRAAVRVVMRLVVVLFAESRELLPRDNALYHTAYSVGGLIEELEKVAARGGNRLSRSWSAWPRLLALFRLVHSGSHHSALPVPTYGGELFAPADPAAADGLSRALAVFETAAFDRELFSDREVRSVLERVTRTRVKLRQGFGSTWVPAPVDFSDLSSEYIGILYEGLLDFELKTAPPGDPVIFLAVGNQPALPLSRLEAMDDKALGSLLEKMKDASKKDDDASGEEEGTAEDDADDDAEAGSTAKAGEDDDVEEDEEESTSAPDAERASAGPGDQRHVTRTRAEEWAGRAVEVGRLTPRPRGKLTPEKRRAYEEAVSRKARQLVVRVVLPSEWYLVRWGGTRKGSGTFYTRPGLAVPTVQRTLRPLAYVPPTKPDGAVDADAPAAEWSPRLPEEILALKVCDPACGSGTFPLAALRFLTEALYAAVHHHGRVSDQGDRSVVDLLTPRGDLGGGETLGQELLPCRPDDPAFEGRLKAVLKRYVVERCVYGVDLDPLAVELCRLALWIETMDRTLPFSFLDHKVKCGNSLIGAWFDQFMHYPVMAWKNREGGDKSHSNGVHFQKDVRTKKFKAFVTDKVAPDLRRLLEGRTLFSEDLLRQATTVHDDGLAALSRLHDLPVHDSAERARLYREQFVDSPAYQALKQAMDLWCACWFWPVDELEHVPLPTTFGEPAEEARSIAARTAADHRFFHWELEFPDVFRDRSPGFDSVLGNPPWDIAKANSREFFSNLDPLYRALGNPEARQTALFADAAVERDWLDHTERFVAWSNFVNCASNPCGDPERASASEDAFTVAKGGANAELHGIWRTARDRSRGFTGPDHPFQSQGGSDLNMYKLFVEQMVRLLRPNGLLGVVAPAAIYNDSGAAGLRRLLLTDCDLRWLFSFENRARIFPIHRSFRFCCLIARRSVPTRSVRMAFGRRDLSDWAEAERLVILLPSADLHLFSPVSSAILEVDTVRDLEVLRTLFARGIVLGGQEASGWGVKYNSNTTDYHMTRARQAGRILAVDTALDGATRVAPGHWRGRDKSFIAFYTGKMVSQFDFAFQRWVSGHGVRAAWQPLEFARKDWGPEFVAPLETVRHRWRGGNAASVSRYYECHK